MKGRLIGAGPLGTRVVSPGPRRDPSQLRRFAHPLGGSGQDGVAAWFASSPTPSPTGRPRFGAAVDTAFLDGLALGCTVVGILCLVGALAAAVSLHADRYDPLDPAHEALGGVVERTEASR